MRPLVANFLFLAAILIPSLTTDDGDATDWNGSDEATLEIGACVVLVLLAEGF